MEEKLRRFSERYHGFFRRKHYRGHKSEERDIADRLREEHHLTGKPLVMHPVEAIGLTKDITSLIDKVSSSSMTIDDIVRQYERFYDSSFLTKAFFFYALAKYLGGQEDMDEIAEAAQEDFQIQGQYSIGKLHKPKEGVGTTIFFDWHDTLSVGGGLKPNLPAFFDYCKRSGNGNYSLVITSATFNLMRELGEFENVLDEIDAAYEVPIIFPGHIKGGSVLQLDKAGKIYTDICKKLGVRSDSAIIITDAPADKSVEESYPILTLVTPKGVGADSWVTLLEYFESQGGNITKTANAIRTSPVYIHDNGVREYEVNELMLYRHWRLHNCFFIEEFTEKMMMNTGIGPLDKKG